MNLDPRCSLRNGFEKLSQVHDRDPKIRFLLNLTVVSPKPLNGLSLQ